MRSGVAIVVLLVLASPSEAASCRGYPPSVHALIKGRVEAVRLVEREAADRMAGLDTRTYLYLAGEARKAADGIASPADLADEEGLSRCRNFVQPVRSICRGAALALATMLDRQEAGTPGADARRTYSQAMPPCERLMQLVPLTTAIRTAD